MKSAWSISKKNTVNKEFVRRYMEEDMKKTYKLKGLDCANCLAKMERKISRLKGVRNVTSNFFTEKMVIEADDILMPEIASEVTDAKIGKVNIDEQPELASAFGIMSIPTLVAVKDGKIVNKMVGVRPKASILQMLAS
jgi:copper chaperone CopZ